METLDLLNLLNNIELGKDICLIDTVTCVQLDRYLFLTNKPHHKFSVYVNGRYKGEIYTIFP